MNMLCPQLPPDVGVGSLISFEYPRLIKSGLKWESHTISIESIKDTDGTPADRHAAALKCYAIRGRWRIKGVNLDSDKSRSFYAEAMRNIQEKAWLRLGIYDPVEDDYPIQMLRDIFAPTRRDQERLSYLLDYVNRRVAAMPEISMCLGVFPEKHGQEYVA
jgi:hypothetical protein